MTMLAVGPAKGKKDVEPQQGIHSKLAERKTTIGSDGRKYGASYNELAIRAYGRIPRPERKNFYDGK